MVVGSIELVFYQRFRNNKRLNNDCIPPMMGSKNDVAHIYIYICIYLFIYIYIYKYIYEEMSRAIWTSIYGKCATL